MAIMRIATLGIHHETNTFASNRTTLEAFQHSGLQTYGVQRGSEYIEMQRNAQTSLAGFLKAADELDFELVPLIFAATDPSGTISSEAFESLANEGLKMLREQGPFDAVLLNQMGAAVSEEFPDMDGELARRVREVVGPKVPVAMTLDLHANVSQLMADETDALVIYRTNPHIDAVPRAVDAARLVVEMARDDWRPQKWLEKPPMVIGIFQHDTREKPMKGIIDDLEEVLLRPGVVSTSVGQGYPWADVYENGLAIYVLHRDSEHAAREAAQWIAERAWRHRFELNVPKGPIAEEAVDEAISTLSADGSGDGPVVLLDVGDNIGAGSTGDSTFLLAVAMRRSLRSWLQTIRDPDAAAACFSAGKGERVSLEVGGKSDGLHGSPVKLNGVVTVLSDGRFEDSGTVHAGWRYFDGGPTAVVESDAGPTVALVSSRVGHMSREQFYSLGYRPEEFDIVVAKGVVSPRPAYQPIARRMITVNTPGATGGDMSHFLFKRIRRPIFPLDPAARYEPMQDTTARS